MESVQIDTCKLAGELLSDIRTDKCVSRSALPLTVLFASSFPSVLVCHALAPVASSPGPQ